MSAPRPARPALGRGPKVRAAVLAATLVELAASGYADLSVENVALRAGVHKTTVYRRWPDREALVADALTDTVAQGVPSPDTGTFEGDLRQLARSLIAWLTSDTGAPIFSTLISADRVPEIAQIKRSFFVDRLRRHEALVTRAIARGEVPDDTDPADVIKALIAPIYLRLTITAEAVDEHTADAAARVTLVAAQAGAFGRSHLPARGVRQ